MPRKTKTIHVGIPLINHEIYFAVQKAFQSNGVTLVDLNSNKIIKGQVNLTDIGLIRTDKIKPKTRRSFGFVSSEEPISDNKVDRVEATLTILGNPESEAIPILICVINTHDVNDWIPIITQVATNFIKVSKSKPVYLAKFEIETLCLPDPNDPQSAIEAMLDRIQKSRSDSVDAFSDQDIPLSDEDFDDEE